MKTKFNLPVILLTFANDKVDDALYLRNLPLELNQIRTALHQAAQAGLCEIVERTAASVNDIFDIFQDARYENRIAIFHYGGHAGGGELMLEALDGSHQTAYSEGLIPFLGRQKGLQLAFFNGCSSQIQATQLSEAGVPAVIGTSAAINDAIATDLASRFYNGMASGATIHQAWLEAIDVVKAKTKTTDQTRGLRFRRDKSKDFPWNMYIREGAEMVKHWNLPDAANHPLFGLPELPKMNLPEAPFRFLRRYTPEHAEIFFGRDHYIRQLYDRITSPNAAPIILFYGQSGAGKSSTLDSGLLPRLQQEADVKYVRRDIEVGLLGTLDQALGGNFRSAVVRDQKGRDILVADIQQKIEALNDFKNILDENIHPTINQLAEQFQQKLTEQQINIDNNPQNSRLERWLAIEAQTGRPFHVLLDQVEETFTRHNPALTNELEELLTAIHEIFTNPNQRPLGKIILSYRKEYHPEILEHCKKEQLPREEIFLKKLSKADIEEVVAGIASSERLRRRYLLSVEPDLPAIIADDLLEDKNSPIAPVLSILLTKMWRLAQAESTSILSVAQYQRLKKEGILMEDFFHQQMEALQSDSRLRSLEASGLALDVLNFHTTVLGTAGSQSIERLRTRYEHQAAAIDGLLTKFKDLYLLTDAGTSQTGLAHDTLAPIIIKETRTSDKMGQRALRVLESKLNEYVEDRSNILDDRDLRLVEEGKNGMRLWSKTEAELVKASQARRAKQRALRRNLMLTAVAAVLVIFGLGYYTYHKEQLNITQNLANTALTYYAANDYTNSIILAKEALKRDPNNAKAYSAFLKSKYAHLYKINDDYYRTPTALPAFEGLQHLTITTDTLIPRQVAGHQVDDAGREKIVVQKLDGSRIFEYTFKNPKEAIEGLSLAPNGKYLCALTTFEEAKDSIRLSLKVFHLNSSTADNPVYSFSDTISELALTAFLFKGNYLAFSGQGNYLVYHMPMGENYRCQMQLLSLQDTPTLIATHLNYCNEEVSTQMFSPREKYFSLMGNVYPLDGNGSTAIKFREASYDTTSYFSGKSHIKIIENDMGEQIQVFRSRLNPEAPPLDSQVLLKTIQTPLALSYYSEVNITSDEQYYIIDRTYKGDNLIKDVEILTADASSDGFSVNGEFAAYHPKQQLIATTTNTETIVLYFAGKMISNEFRGSFRGFSEEGNFLFTQMNNQTYMYSLSPYEVTTAAEGLPLAVFYGDFIDISGNYLITSNSIYPLNHHLGKYFEESYIFYSEDAQYLIQDDGNHFKIFDANVTGRVSATGIDAATYQKEIWQPYRRKTYPSVEEIYSEFDLYTDSTIYLLNNQVKVDLKEEWIGEGRNKYFLEVHKKQNNGWTEITLLPLNGEEIISITPKANNTAIEVISWKRGSPRTLPEFYTQLYELNYD